MRWMFIGAATQWPVGFITGSSSGATTLSQPPRTWRGRRDWRSCRSAFHSAISGPLSCTAGGALPATTSARSFASVLAVWPAIEVCSHLPPAAVNISPSLAIAAASEPSDHWCSMLVFGSARARAGHRQQTPLRPEPSSSSASFPPLSRAGEFSRPWSRTICAFARLRIISISKELACQPKRARGGCVEDELQSLLGRCRRRQRRRRASCACLSERGAVSANEISRADRPRPLHDFHCARGIARRARHDRDRRRARPRAASAGRPLPSRSIRRPGPASGCTCRSRRSRWWRRTSRILSFLKKLCRSGATTRPPPPSRPRAAPCAKSAGRRPVAWRSVIGVGVAFSGPVAPDGRDTAGEHHPDLGRRQPPRSVRAGVRAADLRRQRKQLLGDRRNDLGRGGRRRGFRVVQDRHRRRRRDRRQWPRADRASRAAAASSAI